MNTAKKNQKKIREGSVIADVIIFVVVALLAFLCLYPMYFVLVTSLSDPAYAQQMNTYWWPRSESGIFLGTYKRLVTDMTMWKAYANTIVYTIIPTFLMLVTCCLCAYPLTSPKLVGRKICNIFLLIPMYFGGGLIPTFILMTKLGLYNNIWAIIIPAAFNIWYIILTRSYFRSIPESLRESAKLDGANSYQILFRVFLPTSKPILAVVALYTIIGVWNSWYHASSYITDQSWQPLQMFLRRILIEQTEQLGDMLNDAEAMRRAQEQQISNNQMKYTVIIVSSLPMLIAYPFFQQYFVKGVMLGSLKE